MYKKLQVEYNVDKLELIYEVPDGFMTAINEQNHLAEIFNPSNIFIFTRKFFSTDYVVDRYELSWKAFGDFNCIKIGELARNIKGCVTMTVFNEFLYSGKLNLIYEFERVYNLQFKKINIMDVCCDASNDLPRKLNAILHDRKCEVTRRGKIKELTDKGNQCLGTRISANIKLLTDKREIPSSSYYYYLTPSGAKKPIVLRGYNKTQEVQSKKEKEYILSQYSFSPVYRLEVSVCSYELVKLAKTQTGWSQEYIYTHLEDKTLLREFFMRYINRFYTITFNGRKYSIAEVLRLE